MRCLCCGKELSAEASLQELAAQWHSNCVRKFFGTSILPELDTSEATLALIAAESTNKGLTVPGVQKKISLHLTTGSGRPRLTLVDYPTGFILKPQTAEYEALPEAEYLVMQMARVTGIATVPFALIRMSGDHFSTSYITRRIDRILPTYQGSYERCAKVISRYSQRPGLDLSELFLRVVFSFLVGNSDMHLKNFSLVETSAGSQRYVLSEACDMLPVNVILPEDDEELALTVNGKKHHIHRNDFLKFAETSGISREAAVKMIQKLLSMQDQYLRMCEESYLPNHLKERLVVLINERAAALRPG